MKTDINKNTLYSGIRQPSSAYLILLSVFIAAYTIAPLLALKIVKIGPFVLPAGDFIYALTFLCTDISQEVFGKKEARRIVSCGLITMVIVYLFIQITMLLPAASFWTGESAYNTFFGAGSRIFLATSSAYIFSQLADLYVFQYLKKIMKTKHLWLRNNVSTCVARLLDIVIFTVIAFYGAYENSEILTIIFSGYVVGVIISVCDTPLVYLGVIVLRRGSMTKIDQ